LAGFYNFYFISGRFLQKQQKKHLFKNVRLVQFLTFGSVFLVLNRTGRITENNTYLFEIMENNVGYLSLYLHMYLAM